VEQVGVVSHFQSARGVVDLEGRLGEREVLGWSYFADHMGKILEGSLANLPSHRILKHLILEVVFARPALLHIT